MTSVTDSILNSVILLSVILILGIIVVGASLQNTRLGGELEYTTLLEEQTDAAAESFLTSTVKGESMRKLLGRAMVELQTNVSIENHTIDLVAESERRLDAIYGKDNYYFRLDPVIRGVNLMFVFDYSPSTQSEIAIIRDNLELIQNEIENFIQSEGSGEEKVSIQVFMLPGSPGRCAEINGLSLRNTQCFELIPQQIYEGREMPDFGLSSYEEWEIRMHYATVMTFAQSDWATGTTYAANYYDNNPFLKQQSSINFIFPMSDELASTSKANSCFVRATVSEFIVCQMCDNACPGSASERSLSLVEQTITSMQELQTQSRVFPIYSVACDFDYEPSYNQISYSTESYYTQFKDAGPFSRDEYPEVTWCSQSACTACERQGSNFCFQNQCWPALQEQMTLLADSSGGELINVQNVGTIPEQLLDSFNQTIKEFDLSVGNLDTDRERFIHEKIVRLPNGFLSKLSLWVYR